MTYAYGFSVRQKNMELETFTPKLKSFLDEASVITKESFGYSEVLTVGLHISPVDGYVGFAIHTEKIESSTSFGIPDFDHSEVHYTGFEEWDDNYWNKKEKVSFGSHVVSPVDCEGDEEYAAIFVEWASSVLEAHSLQPDSPFSGAMLCVHPVASEPYKLWEVQKKA